MVDKKAINYYRSFYDVSKDLNQKQFYDFNMAVYQVMFFEVHIDEIVFEDKMLSILWKSVKHSVRASVDGYCTKKSTPYDTLFDPLTKPLSKPLSNKNNKQEQEQEQGEVEPARVQISTEIVTSPMCVSTEGLKIAHYLLSKITANKPNFKQPNLNTWAKDIDKAIRLDNRTAQELTGCIDWIYSADGSFWVPNILSAKKLREKFDTMESQMVSKTKKNNLDMSWMEELENENAS